MFDIKDTTAYSVYFPLTSTGAHHNIKEDNQNNYKYDYETEVEVKVKIVCCYGGMAVWCYGSRVT